MSTARRSRSLPSLDQSTCKTPGTSEVTTQDDSTCLHQGSLAWARLRSSPEKAAGHLPASAQGSPHTQGPDISACSVPALDFSSLYEETRKIHKLSVEARQRIGEKDRELLESVRQSHRSQREALDAHRMLSYREGQLVDVLREQKHLHEALGRLALDKKKLKEELRQRSKMAHHNPREARHAAISQSSSGSSAAADLERQLVCRLDAASSRRRRQELRQLEATSARELEAEKRWAESEEKRAEAQSLLLEAQQREQASQLELDQRERQLHQAQEGQAELHERMRRAEERTEKLATRVEQLMQQLQQSDEAHRSALLDVVRAEDRAREAEGRIEVYKRKLQESRSQRSASLPQRYLADRRRPEQFAAEKALQVPGGLLAGKVKAQADLLDSAWRLARNDSNLGLRNI